ncbi:flavodoxin domain-containing protein [uncultured Roseobacter sp.]|uniref:flavodoxin domain-containing protein n=1 Tax=uncultured Roseobacter sp. TaxID=114847 RepID=UPI0026040E23|nr:flavodoxin domain-containing protein [uncultured Roseobacter sp.]
MNVLIVFATVEGQTRKIAEFAQRIAEKAGYNVTLFDAADKTAPLSLEAIDKVILAAPVHERRHPETFEVVLGAHRTELAERDTLLLSISLSAAFEDGMEEAQEYITEMEMRTRFKSDLNALVAGAVRTSSYDYFATQVLRHVVLRDRDYDPGAGEHEFTDWDALQEVLVAFLEAETTSAQPPTQASSG